MSKALVTGATGFIGSHLVDALLERGDCVRALMRSASLAETLKEKKVELVKGDYRDLASLKEAVAGVDYVYHVAGVTKALDEKTYVEGNVVATENLLIATLEANPNLKRFLHVSSGAAAGSSPSADNPIDESAPPKPVTLYGKTKLQAEEVCKRFFDKLPITIVRPSIIYGERDKDLLEHFKTVQSGVVPIFGFGEKKYDYLYVKDLIEGMIAAAESDKTKGEIYFLSGKAHSWEEVGEAAKRALGKSFALKLVFPDWLSYAVAAVVEDINKARGKISILNRDRARDGKERYWTFSTKKAERDFGFAPKTSLQDGFKRTVKWYREQGWL
ncbi:MAG: NAD-dependent epimerase/dehydratase family protein [Chloroherpetonaceae bacterium]|nr:NAD-dependent epimerase/dehydratase family protein [Chloroherpetonaceae bacterium]MDW8437932.1 NAD-dependent epimerase/dehydratase family protein [Chloroherpetonaceae bacterium]